MLAHQEVGKTTICNGICEKIHYKHIPFDAIIRGFQNNFPETGITHSDVPINVSKKLAPFINTMIEDSEQPLLLDLYHLVPEDYVNFINTDLCNILFVGYPNISPQEKLKEMRTYDKREENRILTDTQLLEKLKRHINESIYLERECQKYDLPFINTSYERMSVINNAINEISELYS